MSLNSYLFGLSIVELIFAEIMDTLIAISSEVETPSQFWFGPKLVVVIGKPDDVKTVLTSMNCLEKPYIYKFLRNNNGLFNATSKLYLL